MAATVNTSRSEKSLVPPDERFWKRYSPHHEFPLASATSVFVHGLVIGILAMGGIAFLFRGSLEASKPPQMDVLLVEGDLGFGGPGGDPGLPGLPGDPGGRTEGGLGPISPAGPDTGSDSNPDDPELPPVPGMQLDLPTDDKTMPDGPDVLDELSKIGKDADKRSKTPEVKQAGPILKGGAPGSKGPGGSPKGAAGQGGTGGIGKGPGGPGTGGTGGRKPTDQEIKAWRWRFDLTGGPKEHAEKLDKAGLMVAVPDPAGGPPDPKKGKHLFITDLKRRPVKLEPGDFTRYDDAVKWYNTKKDSVLGLAQEMQLKEAPAYIVLLLPKDREAKMAAEELRFAKQNNNDPKKVTETWFDFRLHNGVYEPVAIKQK